MVVVMSWNTTSYNFMIILVMLVLEDGKKGNGIAVP